MKEINWKQLLLHIAIPLAVGGLAALLTGDSTSIYASLEKPPLSPPAIVFPIVWTILYTLMGISAYLVSHTDTLKEEQKRAWVLYGVQLAINFFWPLLFFRFHVWLLSFIWLVLLWTTVALMIQAFQKINKTAAWLQIAYLVWITFAGYLNLGIYLFNR